MVVVIHWDSFGRTEGVILGWNAGEFPWTILQVLNDESQMGLKEEFLESS